MRVVLALGRKSQDPPDRGAVIAKQEGPPDTMGVAAVSETLLAIEIRQARPLELV
jgi:hypothetical protein